MCTRQPGFEDEMCSLGNCMQGESSLEALVRKKVSTQG